MTVITKVFFLWAVVFMLMSKSAAAYIDPGTGSMVFQALVAGIVGALFTIKMYWQVLKRKLKGIFYKTGTDGQAACSKDDGAGASKD